ncbi:MAG TPA: TonB-dependent receptor [Vicinamibacterales bacterium]|nr:TonB-dependent receptor [Vicinamibacterales bacterium]
MALVAATLLCAGPAVASGQSAAELQQATLEDLMNITVTTASRRAEGASEAPAHVEVITARQIRARGYQSLGDLLRDQLGIKVELGADQDYPSDITVLGTRNTSRVVLLMDGVRISSPTGEPLPVMANYPIHNARQVEIVFGPASALYGADAFAAVINIVNRDVSESAGLTASATVGQFGLSNNSATYGRRIGESASVLVSGQWFRDAQADLSTFYPELFGGMTAQRNNVFNTIFGPMAASGAIASGFENPQAAHSVHAAFSVSGLQLSLFQSRQRSSTSVPYTPDNAVYDADAYQQNDLWVGSASYTRRAGAVTSISGLTFSRHELSPQSGYWNVFSNLRRSYKYAYGSMAKVEQQFSWPLGARTLMTAGGTFERFFAIPQGADLNSPVRSRNEPGTILDTNIVDEFIKTRYSNTGGYLQAQFAPSSWVALTAGTRADYNSRFGGTFNPRVGAVFTPAGGTTAKLLFGTAYLAPSAYQEGSHFGSFYSNDGGATYESDFWHLGNADLVPQRKSTWEASLTQPIGSLMNVTANVFHSRIDNVLKRFDADRAGPGTYRGWPVAYIEFPVNEGVQVIHGALIDANFLKSWSSTTRLQARAGVSLVDGYDKDDDNPLRVQLGGMAPTQFRVSVDVEHRRWSASTSIMMFGRQRVLAAAEDGTSRATLPGFSVVNLNLRRNQVMRNIDAFLRVENLFDARYVHLNERAYSNDEELNGSPQSPRRLSAGFTVRIGQ